MKKFTGILITVILYASPQLFAGVVLKMVTKDGSGKETAVSTVSAQSEMVRIDNAGDNDAGQVSMIFRGEDFLILNHKEKTYSVMDEAMIDEMSTQMSAAMKQMEEQLANIPPEQRAMVERMMKGQMKGMMPPQGQAEQPPPPRVEKGGSSEWSGYPCVKYTLYVGDEKTQEICAASVDEIEGSEEVMGAFRKMAEFMKKMIGSLPGSFGSAIAESPMGMMDQVDGFPVHTLHFEKGEVSQEVSLESATEQPLEDALFTPPDDYKRQDLFKRP